ncbi:MAG: pre-peptidase C-terminal domain-containing protein [Microthrixaceae bacterium]|nr:pre-peptidase C-terminal domain-containing protein [Microthrixaceae bacterium]
MLLGTVGVVSGPASAQNVQLPTLDSPVRIRNRVGEDAIRALGSRLDGVADRLSLRGDQLAEVVRRDRTLSVDASSELVVHDEAADHALSAASAADWPTTPVFPDIKTFSLHSKSSNVKRTIYLDFNGHTMTGTTWNTAENRNSITLAPFDLDGKPSTFTRSELAVIQNVYLSVREDFGVFDVDVTTADPGTAALAKSSAGDDTYGIRIVVTPTDFQDCDCGGAAYPGSFGSSTGTPGYVLQGTAKTIAEAVSHEAGHTLGLSHDGVTTKDAACAADSKKCSYYRGHGDWAPIMGVGYYERITQWSKGEYANANNTQDDIAIIKKLIPYVVDWGGTMATARNYPLGTKVYADPINWAGDVDAYSFTVSATRSVTVKVDNWYGDTVDTNLNARIRLLNSSGSVIATASPTATTSAALTLSLAKGKYYVYVDGVGDGIPSTTGYSTYGSIGRYNVSFV